MRLIFTIDKKYDEEMIFEMMPEKTSKESDELADFLRIDDMELMEAKKASRSLSELVHACINGKYKKILPFIKNSSLAYQKSWDGIIDEFYKLVEKKTGYKWKYQKYYCVVSAYHEGISSWGGNKIVRRWSINADTQRKVTAHELVLSHFWNILDSKSISNKWSKEKKWKYSEILSWCLLGLDNDFYKFWPWLLKKDLFPENHEYPEILPTQKKLKELWGNCNDFVDFLDKAIKSGY